MGRISDYGKFVDGSLDGLETFGAKQLFDGEIGYRWDAINVSLGARNLFNTYPDQVKIEANTNNGTFIWPGASPFGYNGRYIYCLLYTSDAAAERSSVDLGGRRIIKKKNIK